MQMDRLKDALLEVISSVMGRTDYHALYPSTVIQQNADGTLELRPDVTKVPELSKVPIRVGIPGATLTMQPSSRVLLGFENGNPQRPYASLWDSSTLITIALNGGAIGLAKADHTHDYSLLSVGGSPTGNTTGASSSNTTLVKVT